MLFDDFSEDDIEDAQERLAIMTCEGHMNENEAMQKIIQNYGYFVALQITNRRIKSNCTSRTARLMEELEECIKVM